MKKPWLFVQKTCLIAFLIVVSSCSMFQKAKNSEFVKNSKTCMHQCTQKCMMSGVIQLVQGDIKGGFESSAKCAEECLKVCAVSVTGKCLLQNE